ncbi:MAG: hypothetical protein PUF78_08325 [Lachnospiraceae bacterium]|nr:hypothetical protein [Lachnospiraceae bacterium]
MSSGESIKHKLQANALYRSYHAWRWRERETSKGNKFPDKTFYVIRRHADKAGLFSFFVTNLGSINAAVKRGFIPVIDMQNAPNLLLLPEEVGKVNAWELFFEQPCGFGLKELQSARHVYLGNILPPDDKPEYDTLSDPAEIARWRSVAHQYIKPREDIKQAVQQYLDEHCRGHRVLGVLCRGTDYLQNRPYQHPIQPEPEQVIRDAEEIMKQHDCDLIYLATEDESIWQKFQQRFPGRVISYQQRRYSIQNGQNINVEANRIVSPYERNREYLTSILALSHSNCLLAGIVSGTFGAVLLSDGFEYTKLYQLGRYE